MSNVLQAIADEIEMLTDPRRHSEPRWEWDANRNKKPLPPHVTTVPGLIQQLRDLAEPGNDGEAGGDGGGHSVPLRLSATSLLSSIEYGAAKRLSEAIERGARVDRRQGAEDCLRALAGLAGTFTHSRTRVDPYLCPGSVNRARPNDPADDPYWAEFIDRAMRRAALTPPEVDALLIEARQECASDQVDLEHWAPCHQCDPTTQKELLREVRSWRWQAEIVAGWRAKPRHLPAPCPVCDSHGTLVAFAEQDNPHARCVECGEQWAQEPDDDQGSIGVLSAHVIEYGKRVSERSSAARTAAVEERRRQAGEPPRDTPEVQAST